MDMHHMAPMAPMAPMRLDLLFHNFPPLSACLA